MQKDFLPITKKEMTARGWAEVDFVYVIGDAYVDHPSFGHAIISRVLEQAGYRVAIIAQPDVRRKESIMTFGLPRLGFLVMGGNMDSMVNHYTVAKRKRKMDAYTPGGKMGRRPDYATTAYAKLIRSVYPHASIVLGGIEASLRRLAHYDYWQDTLLPSILVDSGADLLLYGMGEKAIVEVADALNSGLAIGDLSFIKGTVYKSNALPLVDAFVELPAYASMQQSKRIYAESFGEQIKHTDPFFGYTLAEPYDGFYIIQNPPQPPLTTEEMDAVYALPYMRNYHPGYEKQGGIPAIAEVKFSLISNRGCFGSCNFCALTFHQGRIIQSRSHASLLKEAEEMIRDPDFKGYIHDVGGPTANFRKPACKMQLERGACPHKQCLSPAPCASLEVDHSDYLELLRKLRALPGVKKVFVRSGIRFDYMMYDQDDTFFEELVAHHVSGQLKVAPEHVSDDVLSVMGKAPHAVFQAFGEKYRALNRRLGKKQFLVPYLMSSHPGSTLKDAVILAEYLRDLGYMPEQVQDFYPTPSTVATCMYYTGYDPRTMQKVHVVKDPQEKAMQRALIQYKNPRNYDLVHAALTKAGRKDLIGFGEKCLILPRAEDIKKATAEKPRRKKRTIRNVHKKKG
ncbi:MAG: YgiQ family radical SAM protein [Christensenellaceae bacterium]